MAISFKLTDGAKAERQDTFRLAPEEIKKGRNSRMIPAADYEQTVIDRAISIYKNGQLQPAEATKTADRTLVLTWGFTRYDAVVLLRKGFDAIDPDSGEPTRFHDPGAKLWIKVVNVDADEAFLRGVKENLERKDTTDLQEALAQQEIRTTMGWTDAKIARFYGYTNQNRVAALSQLLTLDKKSQKLVHEGKMALYTALDTLKAGLSPDERAAVLDGSTDPKGRVKGEVLRKLIRDLLDAKIAKDSADVPVIGGDPSAGDGEKAAEDGPALDESEKATAKVSKRTVKEFHNFVAELLENEGLDAAVKETLTGLSNWFNAKKGFGDKKLTNLFLGLKAFSE